MYRPKGRLKNIQKDEVGCRAIQVTAAADIQDRAEPLVPEICEQETHRRSPLRQVRRRHRATTTIWMQQGSDVVPCRSYLT